MFPYFNKRMVMNLTNEELVEQIQQGINVQENMTILYECNKRFIYKVVQPFMKYAEPDDLLQEGFLGMYEAVYSYKPGEAKFITYLPYLIRKCCIKYLENYSNTKRIPSYRLNEIRVFKQFCQSYFNEHGYYPDEKTIIKDLELTKVKLKNIRKTIYEQECISIYATAPGTEDAVLEDIIADPVSMEEDVEGKMFQEHERQILDEAISELKEAEQVVIRSRYWENQTQIQIAEEMNVSNSRIGQLERDALRKLKHMDRLQTLHDEVYGYDSSLAYGMSMKYCLDNHTSSTEMFVIKRLEYEEEQKAIAKNIDNIFAELLEG